MSDGDIDGWKVGYEALRELREVPGLYIGLLATAGGGGRIVRCDSDSVIEDWMYPHMFQALAAFTDWDGFGDAPDGWVRSTPAPGTYRRRVNGDPKKEYRRG